MPSAKTNYNGLRLAVPFMANLLKDGLAGLAQSHMRTQACIVKAQIFRVRLQTGLTGHAQSLMRIDAV